MDLERKMEIPDLAQDLNCSRFLADHKCLLIVNYSQIRNRVNGEGEETRGYGRAKVTLFGGDRTGFPGDPSLVSLLLFF